MAAEETSAAVLLQHLSFPPVVAMSSNIVWHEHNVSRQERERLNGHQGCVLWFTGLSGSGKSTIANLVERLLYERGVHTFLLDGDNVRMGLNASEAALRERHGEVYARRFGLGFSAEDREENIRRVGAVAELFAASGTVTLVAFVSPYRRDRDAVRARLASGEFIEVLVDAPLEVCEERDPKGLYKKARAGEIGDFTGVSAPYETPLSPELVLDSSRHAPDVLAEQVVEYLRQVGKIQ